MLLVIEVVFLHNARKVSDLCYVFGLVAGLCLTGVASVACNENLTIHLGKQDVIMQRLNKDQLIFPIELERTFFFRS